MIPGDLLSAFPHRQFHTLPGLLDSWAALPNSNPNACMPMQGGSLYHFYDGLWYDLARPTVREADTLPTEPTRHSIITLGIYDWCIELPVFCRVAGSILFGSWLKRLIYNMNSFVGYISIKLLVSKLTVVLALLL